MFSKRFAAQAHTALFSLLLRS